MIYVMSDDVWGKVADHLDNTGIGWWEPETVDKWIYEKYGLEYKNTSTRYVNLDSGLPEHSHTFHVSSEKLLTLFLLEWT